MPTRAIYEDRPPLMAPVTDADWQRGANPAGLYVVEYGDYTDAASRAAHRECARLCRHFGETIRFVYRHFPRSHFEPRAAEAAEAAEAAGGQGKFWEMHNCLYARAATLGADELVECAASAGLDVLRFLRELSGRKYANKVRRDYLGGVKSGVVATPAFFIGELRHTGGNDFASLRGAIELRAAEDERREAAEQENEGCGKRTKAGSVRTS